MKNVGRVGFTLIELLMVVAVLGFVMIAVTQLLTTTLTGASKSTSIQLVRDNGQFAISTMERLLRNADSVSACSGGPNGPVTFVVTESGSPVTYSFTRNAGTERLQRTRNGGAATDLTDANVSVSTFSCAQTAGSPGIPATYKLSLTLDRTVGNLSSNVKENIASTTFETTVTLRTY